MLGYPSPEPELDIGYYNNQLHYYEAFGWPEMTPFEVTLPAPYTPATPCPTRVRPGMWIDARAVNGTHLERDRNVSCKSSQLHACHDSRA